MEEHQAKGRLKQFSAGIKQEWGKLTDDDVTQAEGNIEELISRVQEKYGESREAIAAKLNELKDRTS